MQFPIERPAFVFMRNAQLHVSSFLWPGILLLGDVLWRQEQRLMAVNEPAEGAGGAAAPVKK